MKRTKLYTQLRMAIAFPPRPMLACTWRVDDRGAIWATPL